MNLQEALDRIAELENEVEAMRIANSNTMNPVYREVVAHLIEGPKSISELAELMTRENRTISQWLHVLKIRHGANIITLADGKKQLVNPEAFMEPLEKEPSSSETPQEKRSI